LTTNKPKPKKKMNGKFLKKAFAVLLTGAALASCSDDNKETLRQPYNYMTPNQAEVAVLYYSLGGGDLDASTELDFCKAAYEIAGSVTNVRYFVQHKYSGKEGYEGYLERTKKSERNYNYVMSGDFGGVYRYELLWGLVNANVQNENFWSTGEKMLNIGEYKIGDAAYQMYQPANMAEFIRWSMMKAPEAQSFVLCMGDHGGGYNPTSDFDKKNLTKGILYDDNMSEKPCMSPQEIAAALNMLSAEERAKIKILCFDCCMMNNLETLAELKGLVPYVIASSHSVPAADQGIFVRCMGQSRGQLGAMAEASKAYITEVQKKLKKEFVDEDRKNAFTRNLDFTVTDMSKMDALLTAIKNMREFLTSESNAATLTAKKEGYDKAASQCYHFFNSAPFYDLVDYVNKLSEHVFADNEEFKTLAAEVKKAAKAAMYAHAGHSYSLDPENGDDLKGHTFTYSITLGSNAARYNFTGEAEDTNPNQGAIVICPQDGDGTAEDNYRRDILLEDGNMFYHIWQSGDPGDNQRIFDKKHPHSASYKSWAETYEKTAFDKATGWSQWMKKNPGLPIGNPPTDDSDESGDWLLDYLY